jgi:hypothetical protein
MTGSSLPATDASAPASTAAFRPIRSKTLATWIACLGGSLGLHRFYLRGLGDWIGWLHPAPALAGLVGVSRMVRLGQDDQLAWVLIPLLGFALSAGFLAAIVIGLTPDAKWARRHGRRQGQPEIEPEQLDPDERTGWGPVIGVILSLAVGGAVLMGTIAFCGQRYFEYQAQSEAQ